MSTEVKLPEHEKLKRDLASRFESQTTYLGSFIKKEIIETDFKQVKNNVQRPIYIKKGDVIISFEGKKARPSVIVKVLKDKTLLHIPLTSTENMHCMTPFKSRFFGEGCFTRAMSSCSEEYAIENFVGVFDNMKALNLAIKDFKHLINTNLK